MAGGGGGHKHRGQRTCLAFRSQRSEVHLANQWLEATTTTVGLGPAEVMVKL